MSLSADKYCAVYMLILELVETLNKNKYHKAKFAQAHELWAHQGWFVGFFTLISQISYVYDTSACRSIQLKMITPCQEALLSILTRLYEH